MENNLQVFENSNFGRLEILVENGKEYFPAKEVAAILGYKNPADAILRHCKNEGVVFHEGVANSGFGEQTVSKKFIDEGNLYRLIVKSNLPQSEPFESWVFDEVIPSIRKTGMYMTDNIWERLIQNPEQFGKMIIEYAQARKENDILKLENKVRAQQIAELQPKATYYDLILQNNSLLSVTQIAKDYGVSAQALNSKLHELGVQFNQGGVWLLYQQHAPYGYTHSKTQNYNKSDGSQGSRVHTYWAQKGRIFLYELLKTNGIVPLIERTE